MNPSVDFIQEVASEKALLAEFIVVFIFVVLYMFRQEAEGDVNG